MPERICRFVVLTAACATLLFGQRLLAATYVVGPSTCNSTRVHYSTIQAAVSSVPAGSTIFVCPGTYPEQVVITQPLTLEGVTDGTGNAAVITVPAGGLVQNGTISTLGPVAVQLLVQNTVLVTIQNLTIDGTGAGCVAGANRVFGIEFSNVGMSVDGVSGGKIEDVVVRNLLDTCTFTDGIEIDQSYVTITNNEVHDIDITPIGSTGGQVSITNNTIQNALNGIVVASSTAPNVVSNNTVANLGPSVGFTLPVGYWLDAGVATIKSNVLSHAPGGYGVYTAPSYEGTTISENKVSDTYVGLYVDTVTANTVFQSNTISKTTYAIADLSTGGGNNITKNTVNEAAYGIYETTPVTDTLTPNTYYNTIVTIDPNPFTNPGGYTPY